MKKLQVRVRGKACLRGRVKVGQVDPIWIGSPYPSLLRLLIFLCGLDGLGGTCCHWETSVAENEFHNTRTEA